MKKKLMLTMLSSMLLAANASAAEMEQTKNDDLATLETRIERLEQKESKPASTSAPVKLSGVFANKAMSGTGNGADHTSTWWEKELFLNVDGNMGNTGWQVHAGLDWKWGTDSNGWNGERSFSDRYGDDEKQVNAMIYQLYAKGPVGKDVNATIGLFTPSLQNGVVGDARVIGAEVTYAHENTIYRAYTGKINEKNADMSSDWSDGFTRNGDRYDYSNSNAAGYDNSRSLKAWGLSAEHTFNNKLAAGIGYYSYDSPNAYLGDKLSIAAVNGSYKLTDDIELSSFYSLGNRGHQNKAFDLKVTYNGSPWAGKKWGGSIGYRYLGADALIKSSITHGSEKPGNKGIEASLWYRFNSNIHIENYFFFGKAIDGENYNNKHHTAYFSSLVFSF